MNKIKACKTVLIYSARASDWGSCRIITPNLAKAYRSLMPSALVVDYNSEQSPFDLLEQAKAIQAYGPKKMIFIDHFPHPESLFVALSCLGFNFSEVAFYFHVYGDFNLHPASWARLAILLRGCRVEFVAASHRQAKQVEGFLDQKSKGISVCPFPVDKAQYFFDKNIRNKARLSLGLKSTDFMLLYTGRLSMQKNILKMLRLIQELMEANKSLHFYFAGSFDNVGAPFFPGRGSPERYQQKMIDFISELSSEQKRRIRYLGAHSASQLREFYNAADLYASLSTHHDEDFGMSPVEGFFCGTPAVLSNWGGYASFQQNDGSLDLVSVRATKEGLEFSKDDFLNAVVRRLQSSEKNANRKIRHELYANKFSIEAAELILAELHAPPARRFYGFNDTFIEYLERFLYFQRGQPLYPEGPAKEGLYYKIYKNYMEET